MPATPTPPFNPPFPPRASSASLGLFFFVPCLALALAHPAEAGTLKLMIPPGHSELDDLQKDYEKSSKDLQASFEAVQKLAPACQNGEQLSRLVAKGAPWQKAQRERIVKALNQSSADLQSQIAQLDQTAAETDSLTGAGNTTVASSRSIIAQGIDKPKAVIQKELPSAKNFSLRLGVANDAAARLLGGDDPACAKAREAFFGKMRPQAEALPEKMKKLVDALEAHRSALNSYADSVSESLVHKSGRAPASQ